MKQIYPCVVSLNLHSMKMLTLLTLSLLLLPYSTLSQPDLQPMLDLKTSLEPVSWTGSGSDPCTWLHVSCSNNRVSSIRLNGLRLRGKLPESFSGLSSLEWLELQDNLLDGPLPSLSGLSELKVLFLNNNNFSSIPSDFFTGMTSLESVSLDHNPFTSWILPNSLKSAVKLREFSANSANLIGTISDFFESFASLTSLHLAMNSLEGKLPVILLGSSIQSLWLNSQNGPVKLSGSVSSLQNMTELVEIRLHGNHFSGPLPDFSTLKLLQYVSLRDNFLTGPVPHSLIKLPSLKIVNLTNNLFQGPTPKFAPNVEADITGWNSFCLSEPGIDCDPRVNLMLSIDESFNYPRVFADDWKENDPCGWTGITCVDGKITQIDFQYKNLEGTISPKFSNIESLEKLYLSYNNLTGTIPDDLTKLNNLTLLDLSGNSLNGKIPLFRKKVIVKTDGNLGSPPPPGSEKSKNKSLDVIIGLVVGGICLICLVAFCIYKGKEKISAKVQSPNIEVVHTHHSGSPCSSRPSDFIETSTMSIPVQSLRDMTDNFSQSNILGRGGFSTVYKGERQDGSKVAVKRMESGVMTEERLEEFNSEIAVLTKVRHKNLVNLIGYSLDGNERLMVYEYMPQGTLSRFLFDWEKEGLRSLEWSKRLMIALDVARGVEYLHSFAHQSFIHRDLKPTNILLGDDLHAKVADFGLICLDPDGKGLVVPRLTGTFGYIAPEYAVTGRISTKSDVYSFGVILMELITGRKVLDDARKEESDFHLVTWFRRMHLDRETFPEVIDASLSLDEETLASILTVAELAVHCSARDPAHRPDMGHAVNVLSSLAESWRPEENEEVLGISFHMTLPQALKKWQALEDFTSSSASNFSTQTSLPDRSLGFVAPRGAPGPVQPTRT